MTYPAGAGEGIDAATLPAAGNITPTASANVAAQIKVDHNTSSCPSKGNLYVAFVAPDSATENANTGPLRSVYVRVSTDAGLDAPTITLRDHKVFTSPADSPAAVNGANNILAALAVENIS